MHSSDQSDMTAREAADMLCETLVQRAEQYYSTKGAASPQHAPRASGIDKCARAMYHQIVSWQDRQPFTTYQVARMQRGSDIEERVLAPFLMQLGFQWLEGQTKVAIHDQDGRVICTGHIDGILGYRGHRFTVDIKTMHPQIFGRIDTLEDLMNDPWCYHYVYQILMYMHAYELETGMLLIDDCLGHFKTILVHREDHEELVAELLQRCELVVDAVRDQEPPDYIDDPTVCTRCRWKEQGVCNPPLDFAEHGGGLKLIANERLEQDLRTCEALDEERKAAAAAKRRIDNAFKELKPGAYLVGPFRVTVEHSERKGYEVKPGTQVKKKIDRLVDEKDHDVLAEKLKASLKEGGAA